MPGIGLCQGVKYESSQLEGLLEEGLARIGTSLTEPDPIQIGIWPYDEVTDYKTLLQYAELWRQANIGESGKVMYLRTFRVCDGVKMPPEKIQDSMDDVYLDPSMISQMLSDTSYVDLETATFKRGEKEIALHFPMGVDSDSPYFMFTGDIGLLEAACERFLGHPIGQLKYELDNVVDMDYLREILAGKEQSPIDMEMVVNAMIDYISS